MGTSVSLDIEGTSTEELVENCALDIGRPHRTSSEQQKKLLDYHPIGSREIGGGHQQCHKHTTENGMGARDS